MTEWQPIDTAPKDGTEILVYGIATGELGGVHEKPETWKVSWFFKNWSLCGGEGYVVWVDSPTHWMPLPAPPANGDGNAFPTVLDFYDGLPETWDEAAKLGTIPKNEFEKIAAKCFDAMLEARKEKK